VPHFSLQVSPKGPLLSAFVGVSIPRRDALITAGQTVPDIVPIQALIDTGASATCLDLSVLKALSLTPTGSASIETPSTGGKPFIADQYDISLIVPPADLNQIPLIVETLPVVCVSIFDSFGYHALIGRDILAKCVFVYNGSMKFFTLAY
jgi:hypothetical protein